MVIKPRVPEADAAQAAGSSISSTMVTTDSGRVISKSLYRQSADQVPASPNEISVKDAWRVVNGQSRTLRFQKQSMHKDSAALIACIPRLRRYARALVGDRTAADDLVQDTLERGWSRLSLWRRGSDMHAWLFSILHNLHIDQVRKPKLAATPVGEEESGLSTRPTQSDELEVRDLEAVLRLLPDEQREILLLIALEEMTYEEVSKTMRIPLGTVMSRLARGREKLRVLMGGYAKISTLKVVK